jgi:hypothetical protein
VVAEVVVGVDHPPPEEEKMRLVYSFAHHDGWFKGWLSQETMGGAQTFE